MHQLISMLTLGIFLLTACDTTPAPVISPILAKPGKRTTIHPDTQITHTYTSYVPVTERLTHAITLQTAEAKTLTYALQGNISSGGHSAQRIQRIRTEQEEQGSVLTVRHRVQIQRMAGKEAAYTLGYNYQQAQTVRIAAHIQSIHIMLIEARNPAPADAPDAPVRAQVQLDWPLQRPLEH